MVQSNKIKNLTIELLDVISDEEYTLYSFENLYPATIKNINVFLKKRHMIYEEMKECLKDNLKCENELKSFLSGVKLKTKSCNTRDQNIAFDFCNSIEENVFLKN